MKTSISKTVYTNPDTNLPKNAKKKSSEIAVFSQFVPFSKLFYKVVEIEGLEPATSAM